MRKLILVAFGIFLFGASLPGQIPQGDFNVTTHIYDGVREYRATFTDVDSADLAATNGLVTDVFDWSFTATGTGSTPSFRYAYTSASANDTLKALLQGYDVLSGNYNILDTIALTALSTTNGGTTTYGTFSLSSYSPYVRIQILNKAATNDQADNGTFEITIYGPPINTNDDRWRR